MKKIAKNVDILSKQNRNLNTPMISRFFISKIEERED